MSKITGKIKAYQAKWAGEYSMGVSGAGKNNIDLMLLDILADVRELEGNYNHCVAVIEARELALPMNMRQAKREAYEHAISILIANRKEQGAYALSHTHANLEAAINALDSEGK